MKYTEKQITKAKINSQNHVPRHMITYHKRYFDVETCCYRTSEIDIMDIVNQIVNKLTISNSNPGN